MRFAYTEEQLLFRKSVREVLARTCPHTAVREAWTSETGRSRERWATLVELGVIGCAIPEQQGGLGMGALELSLALEECGRAALPEPVAETAAIAPAMLREIGNAASEAILARIASGEAMVTVGLEGQRFVSDAHVADVLLLARAGELHAVPGNAVKLEAQRSVDGARRIFLVEWSPSAATKLAEGAVAKRAIDEGRDHASVAIAAQLIGLSRQMVDATVAYVKVRTQFGQPIGSFQALKHMLADAHLGNEMAAPVVQRAAYSLAKRDHERSLHASMAKAFASEAAVNAAKTALQCHGAIGYSYEHELHLWMKRAFALAAAWGDAAHHRARVGDAIGLSQ
jgi:alkylation response protein AidB-like acyl-CoA dehydrogenase